MLELTSSARFRRDFKTCKKRGYDMRTLYDVVHTLRMAEPLPAKYREHALSGNWKGYMECHLSPDWLLVYCITGEELRLARTGTHSDVFGI